MAFDRGLWPTSWDIQDVEQGEIPWPDVLKRLGTVLIEWDFTLDGQEMPCNRDMIEELPDSVVRAIYAHVFADVKAPLAAEGQKRTNPRKGVETRQSRCQAPQVSWSPSETGNLRVSALQAQDPPSQFENWAKILGLKLNAHQVSPTYLHVCYDLGGRKR